MREDYNILTRLIYLAMAGLWRERNELMELEELFRLRQARRYSIHIMASLMGMSVDDISKATGISKDEIERYS